MSPPAALGWYVHHHGSGHLRRFLAVRAALPEVIGLSSLPRPAEVEPGGWLELAPDAPAAAGSDADGGGALHWAPLRHAGLTERMAQIAAWVDAARPAGFVCDVSVEVASFVRLMGIPVVWIAQRGRRRDAPHRLAYALCRVIAPWTQALADGDAGLPDGVRYVGALSRHDGRAPVPAPGAGRVLVLLGGGGHGVSTEDLAAAAAATPDWRWSVAGLGGAAPSGVHDYGQVADTWPLLCGADVVVASAGSNLVAEVAAARRPLVCVPQSRPFDEQRDQAAALTRAGLAEALTSWPPDRAWPGVLERALTRDPSTWSVLHDGRGAQRMAATIRELVCGSA